ncbi:MAG: type II toxin-antitoxin system YafQ family toxin [Muribaculaceae bacterium]|nr:type II toxin-antitoxin system YafQ family toxin [Muribaculaceae bacterium]
MKILRFSTQYKKGRQEVSQSTSSPHLLTGNYAGCMECHVDGDFLLIWIDETKNQIGVLRLGSHSKLFE